MNATPPIAANIQAIVDLERQAKHQRSRLDRITDRVSAIASSATFIVIHVIWFVVWIGLNLSREMTFDPYPFNLLTMAVSLEAIVLTGFVLMEQDRMTRQADRRAHLDLQINLLAEQELTAILKALYLLGERAGLNLRECDPSFNQFVAQTDVRSMAAELDNELDSVTGSPPADAPNRP